MHFTDLRTALEEVFEKTVDVDSPAWTDPVLVPKETVVKFKHLHELRDAVKSLYN